MAIVNITNSKTITAAIDTVLCDATDDDITITLPSLAEACGHTFTIKKIDDSENTVTIEDTALEGGTSIILNSQYESLQITSNGLSYYVVAHEDPAQIDALVNQTILPSSQGDTESRPESPVIGEMYFDTDLGKPIWYSGSEWVFADGTTEA